LGRVLRERRSLRGAWCQHAEGGHAGAAAPRIQTSHVARELIARTRPHMKRQSLHKGDSTMVLPRRLAAGLSALAAAAMVLAAAGCTSGGPPTASGDEGSIVLVHTQAAGDGSVIDSQLAGLKSVGEELGYETSSVYAD